MSYSGGDGQTLGIVLTPRHICELFCDLANLRPDDIVFDPCCGTAGFLIAAMNTMLSKVPNNDIKRNAIKQNQLFGIEEKPDMFSIATTNMILRGDGKSNLENKDFLKQNSSDLQKDICATVGMLNPPYSQGSKDNANLYEIAFVEHLLDSLAKNARCIVIIPQSAVTGKSKAEKVIKENILKHHSLEGVITLNKNTFYGVGTNPCIAVFSAHNPHPKDKICKFINYENDGFEVQKHKGLVQTINAKDKKAHLLNVWFDKMEAESKFCVKTTIEADDEWLHSFYYFNDEIPTQADFEKTMADYLTFEFNMITHGRGYLFGLEYAFGHKAFLERLSRQIIKLPKAQRNPNYEFMESFMRQIEQKQIQTQINNITSKLAQSKPLHFDTSTIQWKEFKLSQFFKNYHGKRLVEKDRIYGNTPLLTAGESSNGVASFIDNQQMTIYKDFISIDMFGNAFYHAYSATGDDNIYFFVNDDLSQQIKLFIVACINMQKSKYSYGKQFRQPNADNARIMLPTDLNGNPHYEFMEKYMRNLEQIQLKKALAYYEKFKS